MCRKKIVFVALISVLMGVLFGTTVFAADNGSADWNDGYITVEGQGVAPDNITNPAQRRGLARRAAIVDGYRALGEYVQGVSIDSNSQVRDLAAASDTTSTNLSAVIRGARIIAETMDSDGLYRVTLKMPLYGANSLASAVLPRNNKVEAFPAPVAPVIPAAPPAGQPSQPAQPPAPLKPQQPVLSSAADVPADAIGLQAKGNYTGLIVDCRGLGLQAVMSPVIKNGNKEPIYGYKNLDYQKVISKGMAGYVQEASNATRAGSNPLTVKAVSLDGAACNPVISTADANKVLVENQASGFLTNCAVVFIQ